MQQPCLYPGIFFQPQSKSGEKRTLIVVIIITALMMRGEITAGILFGSIALLADRLHVASHTIALIINVYAYIYARCHAGDRGVAA